MRPAKSLPRWLPCFLAKNELAEGYGMKRASAIGKEWHEQAAALAKYVEGKTIDEVKTIAVDAG